MKGMVKISKRGVVEEHMNTPIIVIITETFVSEFRGVLTLAIDTSSGVLINLDLPEVDEFNKKVKYSPARRRYWAWLRTNYGTTWHASYVIKSLSTTRTRNLGVSSAKTNLNMIYHVKGDRDTSAFTVMEKTSSKLMKCTAKEHINRGEKAHK
ncbi:uncharacterized protein LOC113308530 [Papaver somniferum]|uniref:uncharacterized protein LOC113308530 n=1 Tax=Papaver somniferum TaxID=3469 RepID=UPI000E7012B7|nr:uncharacterized protein LOC113308530 [Papaver somniferum]